MLTDICQKLGWKSHPPEEMVAVALETLGQMPIYGTRVPAQENGNITWFIHCGEYSDRKDFFLPVHTSHLKDVLPLVLPYLNLPINARFIIDDQGYEDVWMHKEEVISETENSKSV